jgi:hypothetical protein
MSMKAAFNMLLNLHSRPMTINRRGTALTANIKVAPSNYFRSLETAGKISFEGREFVISKDNLDLNSYPEPKRGDALVDSQMGTMPIIEVITMYVIGAEIVGYRVRVG